MEEASKSRPRTNRSDHSRLSPELSESELGDKGLPFTTETMADRVSSSEDATTQSSGHGRRERKAPSHLQDYLGYFTIIKDPTSSSLLQKVSSGKPYL